VDVALVPTVSSAEQPHVSTTQVDRSLASPLPLHHSVPMRLPTFLALCCCTTALAQSTIVDSYIARESPIAKAGLLANIGSSGSKSSGAKVRFFHPLHLAADEVSLYRQEL